MRYYPPAYYGRRGRRFLSAFERLVWVFRKSRSKVLLREVPVPGRVLDLGCGRGLFLAALRRAGWEVAGTEISPELALAVWEELGIQVLTELARGLPFEDESLDAVTAWHSLEHMRDPVGELREAARILKPGGLLFLEVPNAGSLQARLGGRRWFHLDVPRHLHHFSEEQIRRILEETGFVILSVRTLSLEQGPFGMIQSLLNRVTHFQNVLYRIMRIAGARSVPGRRWSRDPRGAVDILVTLLLLLPVGMLGFTLELAACAAGRGGVVRCLSRKPTAR